MSDSSSDRDPVELLAEEFAGRLRRGERPALTEYADRYPEHAEAIRTLFPALVKMEQLKPAADATGAYASAPADARHPERLGDYRILREVGRGGMGIVYEAEQISLGRRVALKVLPGHGLLNETYLERFRREAKAAARLHHTNIVPVFGVGESDGLPYYAMQFIQGEGLDKVLSDLRRLRSQKEPAGRQAPTLTHSGGAAQSLLTGRFNLGPLDAGEKQGLVGDPDRCVPRSGSHTGLASGTDVEFYRGVARVGVQVAEALAYAHKQGILHRDIKPSNLLLDRQGTVWITDFGLAKAEGAGELTQTGDIVGTLRFMAPERFEGRSLPQSDAYGVGVTLYELLTQRPAFDDDNRMKLIERVLHDEPVRPRRLEPRIPRDLETIVLKCLAKDPTERYATADALAEDLRRFVEDRPIRAKRSTPAERAWRWCRRNPALAGLLTVIFALLTVSAVGFGIGNTRLTRALGEANANLGRAEAAEREARLREAEALVGEAHITRHLRSDGQRFGTLAALKKAVEIGRELGQPAPWFDRLRNEAIAALALPDIHITRDWRGWPEGSMHLAVSDDFRVYARSDNTGAVSVRRMNDDIEIGRVPGEGVPSSPFLSPDGTDLVQIRWAHQSKPSGGRVWHLGPTGFREVFQVPDATSMTFMERPEGRLAVFLDLQGVIRVHEAASGRQLAVSAPAGSHWESIVAHPQEPLVAISGYGRRGIRICDIRTGAFVTEETPPWPGGSSCAWHSGGRYFCLCRSDHNEVRVYHFDPASRRLSYWRTIPCGQGHPSLTFNAAGDRFYVAGWDPTVSVWDFWTGQMLFQTRSASPGRGLTLDRAGRELAPAFVPEHADRLGIWSLADAREFRAIVPFAKDHQKGAGWFALHPNGRLAAQPFADQGLRFFDFVTGTEVLALANKSIKQGEFWGSVHFDANGDLYQNSFAGLFRWPVQADPTNPQRWRIGPPSRLPFNPGASGIATSRDGQVVAQAMYAGYGEAAYAGGWILHPKTLAPRHVALGGSYKFASVSPEGRWVAFMVHQVEGVVVYEAATGKRVKEIPGKVGLGRFSPDGRWLLTGGSVGRAYAVDSWEPGPDLGPGFLHDCTADNALAVLSVGGGVFRLVEMATGRELARLEDPDHFAGQAVFHPDGTKLVALAANGLRVWDLRRIRRELGRLGLDWDAPPYPPEESAQTQLPPLEVEVVGAEYVTEPQKMARVEVVSLTAKLLLAPYNAQLHVQLADNLARLGRDEAAYNAYGQAIQWGGDSPTLRYQRMLVAFRLRRWPAVIDDSTQVLVREPDNGRARSLRAQAGRLSGRHADAIADYTEVLKQYPENANLYTHRADCYDALGQSDKAATDREQARKLEPDDPQTLNNLAWRLLTGPADKRDAARALRLIHKVTQKEPDNPLYVNTLGVAQYRNGQYKEAVATLEKSLVAGKGASDAFDLFFLAMCHAKLGDQAKAKDCFDRAGKWFEGKKDLSPQDAEELKSFRAEAEALLAGKAPEK